MMGMANLELIIPTFHCFQYSSFPLSWDCVMADTAV